MPELALATVTPRVEVCVSENDARATVLWTEDRVFLAPTRGCPARCRFCYLTAEQSIGQSDPVHVLEKSVAILLQDATFCAGPDGPIISIGCLGEPFAPRTLLQPRFVFLNCFANVVTQCRLPQDGRFQAMILTASSKQRPFWTLPSTTLYPTSIFFQRSREVLLASRLVAVSCWLAPNITSHRVLYIKPFLPGVTERSKEALVALAKSTHISHAVVGPLFVNEQILTHISSFLPANWRDNYFRQDTHPVGIHSRDFGEDSPELILLEACLRASGISVTHHGTQMSRLLSSEKRNAFRSGNSI